MNLNPHDEFERLLNQTFWKEKGGGGVEGVRNNLKAVLGEFLDVLVRVISMTRNHTLPRRFWNYQVVN